MNTNLFPFYGGRIQCFSIAIFGLLASLVLTGCNSSFPNASNPFGDLRLGGRRPLFGNNDVLTRDNADKFKSNVASREESSSDSDFSMTQRVSYEQEVAAPEWYHSFEEAEKVAMSTNRPMLLMFTGSDWCTWCVRLKKDVFDTPEFHAWAKDNVVLVELDFPRKNKLPFSVKAKNEELKQRFEVQGFPTVVMLGQDGKAMGRLGYKNNADEWIAEASRLLK